MFTLSKRCHDIAGMSYGSLTALHPIGYGPSGDIIWECKCVCGTSVEKTAATLKTSLRLYNDPGFPSCGCLQREHASKNAVSQFTKHGYAKAEKAHPLYKLYQKVRSRCHNPNDTNYTLYGAKGVTMCSEWLGHPEEFIQWCLENGWKPGLQLDKDTLCDVFGIHPKVYSPSTCQFITQHKNLLKSATRSTYGSNKNIKFSQETVDAMISMYKQGSTKADVCRKYGISKTHATRLIPTTH